MSLSLLPSLSPPSGDAGAQIDSDGFKDKHPLVSLSLLPSVSPHSIDAGAQIDSDGFMDTETAMSKSVSDSLPRRVMRGKEGRRLISITIQGKLQPHQSHLMHQ